MTTGRSRIWRDRFGDLWAEYPPGSGRLAWLTGPVLERVGDKFGWNELGDPQIASAFGPLIPLGPEQEHNQL